MRLRQTPAPRVLGHASLAELAAGKDPGLPEDTPRRKIERIALIGAGTMGSGIAMNFLSAGIPVTLLEMSEAALDKGVAAIRRNYEASLKKGRLTPDGLERTMSLLRPTLSYDELAAADLVIEAVFEDMSVKAEVFKKLDRTMKQPSILASNTSTLDLNRIAGVKAGPQQ